MSHGHTPWPSHRPTVGACDHALADIENTNPRHQAALDKERKEAARILEDKKRQCDEWLARQRGAK